MNSGSWLYDAGKARRPDYRPQRWPGTFILIPDRGQPRLVEVLGNLSMEYLEKQLSIYKREMGEEDLEDSDQPPDISVFDQSAENHQTDANSAGY